MYILTFFIEFWASASKNPNKTIRQYDESFEHNVPMPIVVNGDIEFTLEGGMVYVGVLSRIIELHEKDPKCIQKDGNDFLRLIMDHVQLFERHWRKMVVDIRGGTLNRHLKIPEKTKQLYMSTTLPKPGLAVKLDSAFRDLGFHMKVLGKDIVIKSYATRKIPERNKPRRPSFPHDTLGSRNAMALTDAPPTRNGSPQRTLRQSNTLPRGIDFEKTSSPPKLQLSRASSPTKSKSYKISSAALIAAASAGIDSVKALQEREIHLHTRGISMKSRGLERRGSDTDILRTTTVPEIRKIEYDLHAEARSDYSEVILLDGRFLCPFPACGQSFASRDAAFGHLKVHTQKKRLFAPTPLSDSHLNFYWPVDAPWKSEDYNKRLLPPGSVPCTYAGCQEVFLSHHRLNYHIRWVHLSKKNTLSADQIFFEFHGEYTCTPPMPAPIYGSVDFCTLHLHLNSNCEDCNRFDKLEYYPKQPFQFYDNATISFNKRDGKGGVCHFSRLVIEKGVYCRRPNDKKEFMAKPVAFVKDSYSCGWLGVHRFVNVERAKHLKIALPKDPDYAHELLLTVALNDPPIWIKFNDVIRTFYLLESNKEEFSYKLRTGDIPKENVFFVRPVNLRLKQAGLIKTSGSRPVTPSDCLNDSKGSSPLMSHANSRPSTPVHHLPNSIKLPPIGKT